MTPLSGAATEFFDRFVSAFRTFDGKAVSGLFCYPYLAVDQHGSRRVFDNARETARYFQQHLDHYRSIGTVYCSYQALEIVPAGELSALATVTWSLHGADGHELSRWRESYCVVRSAGGLLACASIDHAE